MNYKLAFIGKVEILVWAPKYGPMPKTKNVFFLQMGYSIFCQYKGMDNQIFKHQCTPERMAVWLINTLELNLR